MAKTLRQIRTGYRWDAKSLRYKTPTGRFVSVRSLKQSLNQFVRRSAKEIESLAGQVARGEITVPEWQRAMVDRVKNIHVAQAAASRGGWAQMDARAYGKVGQGLRREYRYLKKFAADVAGGKLAAGTIVSRAGMYAMRGAGVYENNRRDVATDVFTEERNVLAQSEHCEGCKAATEQGWVKVGTLVPIGSRNCLSRCLCRYAFR